MKDEELPSHILEVDAETVQQAVARLKDGTVEPTSLPTTLTYALLSPLKQLIPLAESWEKASLKSEVRVDETLRQNLVQTKQRVGEIVYLIDRSLHLARRSREMEALLRIIADDLKSRVVLIYSGAELIVEEPLEPLSNSERQQLLAFMVRGLQRALWYVDKLLSLDPDITMERLHAWRR